MNAEKFWFSWLKVTAIICIMFGVFIALFNQTRAFEFIIKCISNSFYGSPLFEISLKPLQVWLISIIGATTAGWGLTLWFLIVYPLQNKQKWAWNAIMISLIVWFSLDSGVSYYLGAKFNVVINIILFLQFVAPLLFIRNSMQKTAIQS